MDTAPAPDRPASIDPSMNETIFALSSGAPPAGIAVLRITGPQAAAALAAIAGKVPEPRRAMRATLCSAEGEQLDDALVMFFPGPASVTGEDVAELHLHGGRAIVMAVERELGAMAGLRRAEAGEFTRRAFANGRIDLAEAEGLADLLAAETELQRRSAMRLAGGAFSARVRQWREDLLRLSAEIEAVLDFEDEDDVSALSADFPERAGRLQEELEKAANAPRARTLREGFRVALAGPPNAGKSTLFNALVENEAAITAPLAGTTRDVLTRPVAFGGVPFLFVDMAGLRDDSGDVVEEIGIGRAREEIALADLVLWLGSENEGPERCWEIEAQCDLSGHVRKSAPDFRISAVTGEGMGALKEALIDRARTAMPRPGENAVNDRQARLLGNAAACLGDAVACRDPLLVGESLRQARRSFDALLGLTDTEDVLDALFGRFCVGK